MRVRATFHARPPAWSGSVAGSTICAKVAAAYGKAGTASGHLMVLKYDADVREPCLETVGIGRRKGIVCLGECLHVVPNMPLSINDEPLKLYMCTVIGKIDTPKHMFLPDIYALQI